MSDIEDADAELKRLHALIAKPDDIYKASTRELLRSEMLEQALAKVAELEAANAELREVLSPTKDFVLQKKNAEIEAFKARLAWFEEAWSWVKAAMLRVQELEDAQAFRRDEVLLKLVAPIISKIRDEHPKPEGT